MHVSKSLQQGVQKYPGTTSAGFRPESTLERSTAASLQAAENASDSFRIRRFQDLVGFSGSLRAKIRRPTEHLLALRKAVKTRDGERLVLSQSFQVPKSGGSANFATLAKEF